METRTRNVCYYFSPLDKTLEILRYAGRPLTKQKVEMEVKEKKERKPRKEISVEGRIRLNARKRTKDGKVRRYEDISGQRFGRLTAIEFVGTDIRRCAQWKCRCDCGTELIVKLSNLKTGGSRSCGCLRRDLIIERKNQKQNSI